MTRQITITRPDDWHLHVRDGDILNDVVPATAACFGRAIIMPNLVPPVTDASAAMAYRDRILAAARGTDFQPLMTLYLTESTTAETIREAKAAGVVAAKLYPAGATTNSASGVTDIRNIYPVLEAMADCGMLLLVHGEVTDSDIDIFDREKVFLERVLAPTLTAFPSLRVVLEHITTAESAEFVRNHQGNNLGATLTPQHLMYNRNHMLVGGIRPHLYCLPILKRNKHQEALREAVASGDPRFFLGTDSAPHAKDKKEAACGCAGCYSAYGAIGLYADIFEELGILDKLEAFASFNGADFYGLPRNTDTVTLVREPWTMPENLPLAGGGIVPLKAGETVNWRLA
ncbi:MULTISPECIES: dihydroorotase [Marinobacter]|jgi:dihydroorotase|uniref:Dihydroorotase n=2 Tax=Marinobacter nauticus TaxID=2743 RepID=PYRC_MARN8|nr:MULTISPECIES: dihydroorotase [Marinobacter]A1U3L1.1 RecName: Full=Dihydroorotase; Short=DHOase [Marinobacter nauticus VT8]ABM19580.1 dihydroorotase [Marinobacter nauticus VT8]KAE8543980.1 Dihydroorotase [Marinobacter nauticus]MBY5938933.1 dihydroorotase [Marinobacter nauticus]MBY5956162.1 dihydroorotase [Marinobacter nauticus]MBY6009953.1 dihydroorotase [Marinobacter nauticus]